MGTVLYMLDEGVKTILRIYREPEVGEAVRKEIAEEIERLSFTYEWVEVFSDKCLGEVPDYDERVRFTSKLSHFLPPKTYIDFGHFSVGLAHVPMD